MAKETNIKITLYNVGSDFVGKGKDGYQQWFQFSSNYNVARCKLCPFDPYVKDRFDTYEETKNFMWTHAKVFHKLKVEKLGK